MITYPPWDSNPIPQSTGLSIPAAQSYHWQDGRSSSPVLALIFLFTVPGYYRMGTGYSPSSCYRTCLLSVRCSVLISALLIGSVRGLRQLICVNALSRLQHFISSQIHHSQSCRHQIVRVCKLRWSWRITRTRIRQSVTVTHSCALSTSVGSFRQCEKDEAGREQRKLHVEELRNVYSS
jgi:hypothetical protein